MRDVFIQALGLAVLMLVIGLAVWGWGYGIGWHQALGMCDTVLMGRYQGEIPKECQ